MRLTSEQKKLMQEAASSNQRKAFAAQENLAVALTLPLREGIMPGDIVSDIFTAEDVSDTGNSTVEYPLDFVEPGTEGYYIAHTLPVNGGIPQAFHDGDYLQVPLFDIGAAVDFDYKYLRNARWNLLARAGEVLKGKITQKRNDDGFHVLISAGADRNLIVADSDAAAGAFSVRLVSLAKTVMTRNGGGNASSVNRFRMTDMYLSPEGFEDMRSWNVDQLDEMSRREIFVAPDGVINRIFSVNLHDVVELGEGQKYQLYFTDTLSGTLPSAGNQKLELAVGLDLSRDNCFVNPVGEEFVVNVDDVPRQRTMGLFGSMCLGYGALDARAVLLMAF